MSVAEVVVLDTRSVLPYTPTYHWHKCRYVEGKPVSHWSLKTAQEAGWYRCSTCGYVVDPRDPRR